MRAQTITKMLLAVVIAGCQLPEAMARALSEPCDWWPCGAPECLFDLRAAVELEDCQPVCSCNLDLRKEITATDALLCLRCITGAADLSQCPCDIVETPCTSARITAGANSTLDSGWNGLAHDKPLVRGAAVTVDVVRKCVDDPSTTCRLDSDCASGACRPTCSCDDRCASKCEIAGPTDPSRCVRSLSQCFTNADCDRTNNVSGQGLAIRFGNLTTDSDKATAQIPCLFAGGCTDDGSPCATNADCLRCVGNLTPCASNAECASAACVAAPGVRNRSRAVSGVIAGSATTILPSRA